MEPLTPELMVDTLQVSALAFGVLFILSMGATLVREMAGARPDGRTWRGSIGTVVLAIPEHGIGAVRVAGPFGVTVLPARGIHHEGLAWGARVLIVDLEGRVAEVCSYPEGE